MLFTTNVWFSWQYLWVFKVYFSHAWWSENWITGAIIGYSWKLCELVQLFFGGQSDNIDSVWMANYLSQMSYSQESMCKKISCRSSQVGVTISTLAVIVMVRNQQQTECLPIQGWLDKFQKVPIPWITTVIHHKAHLSVHVNLKRKP